MAFQSIIRLKNQTEYIYLNFSLFSLLTFTNFFLFISYLLLFISFSFLHFSNPIELYPRLEEKILNIQVVKTKEHHKLDKRVCQQGRSFTYMLNHAYGFFLEPNQISFLKQKQGGHMQYQEEEQAMI